MPSNNDGICFAILHQNDNMKKMALLSLLMFVFNLSWSQISKNLYNYKFSCAVADVDNMLKMADTKKEKFSITFITDNQLVIFLKTNANFVKMLIVQ